MGVTIRPYRVEDAILAFVAIEESRDDIKPWRPWCHAEYSIEDSKSYLAISVTGFEEAKSMTSLC